MLVMLTPIRIQIGPGSGLVWRNFPSIPNFTNNALGRVLNS